MFQTEGAIDGCYSNSHLPHICSALAIIAANGGPSLRSRRQEQAQRRTARGFVRARSKRG